MFSGIGGFRLALERAGHTCVAFCEIDKYARQTYKANFNTKNETEWNDITTITDKEIKAFGEKNKTEIICGGTSPQNYYSFTTLSIVLFRPSPYISITSSLFNK